MLGSSESRVATTAPADPAAWFAAYKAILLDIGGAAANVEIDAVQFDGTHHSKVVQLAQFQTLTGTANRIITVNDNGSTQLDYATISGPISGTGFTP